MSFFNELKRRNVFRVGVAYVIISWLLAQVADLMLENFGAPDWVIKSFLGFLIIGFALALFFAWAFELTPEGVKREAEVDRSQSITSQTGRKLNNTIMVIMAIALAWFAWDKFDMGSGSISPEVAQISENSEIGKLNLTPVPAKSIAVLPFVAMSSGPDDEYFADGLTEEILNSLAQLPELLVTARTSAFHFKGQDIPVQEIATALGVNHIVEGSVRKSGQRLRVTAQLIRAEDGFHLWSENYDSTSEDTITVQEDIAEKIAHAMEVVMDDQKRDAMRKAGLRDVEAFIAYQKGLELFGKAHGNLEILNILREANRYFETVMQKVPGFAPPYIEHSDFYVHILLNDATGQSITGVTDEEFSNALEYAIADYTAAVEHANNPIQRLSAEIDLALITGNWRGMPRKVEQLVKIPGCVSSNWISTVAPPFGYAGHFLKKAHENRICDPLSSHAWFTESRAALWSGDPATALEIAQQGDKVAPGDWLNMALFRALLAMEEFEQAEEEINSRFQSAFEVLVSRTMLAATLGDREQTTASLEEYLLDPDSAGFWKMILYAWSGDKENANAAAAKMDSHPYGPSALLSMVYWCACGAPWELDATPVFASKIRESGLPWPPVSPIRFPLKDW
jgi:TolB-like protein